MSSQVNPAPISDSTSGFERNLQELSRNRQPPRQHNYRLEQFPIQPERVLRAFNTRAFKREQPDNSGLLLQTVAASISQSKPIPFVLYWGKGLRANLEEPEIKCLDYLYSLATRVREAYPAGASMRIIFTDTHAELNGHSQQSIRSYYEELSASARQRGFEVGLLSALVATQGQGIEPGCANDSVPEELLATLCASAAKWFHGDGTVEQGALLYYRMNMIEKRVIERAFPGSIFVTFNGSELRSLFPDSLPIFYMFSVRHGVCAKPWFLPADYLSRHEPSNVHRLELAS
jgi:hypothetical protein